MKKNATLLQGFGPYPGYWTELVILHDFPPGWLPGEWGRDETAASQLASEAREKQVALGRMGTIVGMSAKSDARLMEVREPVTLIPRRG